MSSNFRLYSENPVNNPYFEIIILFWEIRIPSKYLDSVVIINSTKAPKSIRNTVKLKLIPQIKKYIITAIPNQKTSFFIRELGFWSYMYMEFFNAVRYGR